MSFNCRWFFAALILSGAVAPGIADEGAMQRRPKVFAIVFNMGYAGDNLPKESEPFETLVKSVKAAHFNVILGQYDAKRVEICKKHGLLWFVDLLVPEHHIFKNPEGARKLCESLKDNDAIYGYHLWSDNIAETYAGRTRDVANVQTWDPNHATYVGCASMNRVNRVEGMDLFGYYDFHWKRGKHWANLSRAKEVATGKGIPFLRYDDAAPGLVGKGNPNRVGYTWATSIPFGLKGYTYHYTGGIVDKTRWALDALGQDLEKVNGQFASVGVELMKVGLPVTVYSTPVTKTEKGEATNMPAAVPGGLTAMPKDHWFQVGAGEVIVGQFADADKRDVLVLASHNAYEGQTVTLQIPAGAKRIEAFDRMQRAWKELKSADNSVSFRVEEASVELVRVTR